MKLAFVTISLAIVFSQAFAHGMNKLGPHGGYVRMPGSYHVELVPEIELTKVYFLDMNFKKMDILKSQASMVLKGSKEIEVPCAKEAEFFKCAIKKKDLGQYTEVKLMVSRNGEKKVEATYKIPLTLM